MISTKIKGLNVNATYRLLYTTIIIYLYLNISRLKITIYNNVKENMNYIILINNKIK